MMSKKDVQCRMCEPSCDSVTENREMTEIFE